MELVLESERLVLRPLALSDADLEVEIVTDPDIMKYVGETEPAEMIVQDMPKYTRRCAGGCIGIWCVADRLTNEKLGTAVLLPVPIDEEDTNWDLVVGDDLPAGEIEIGYMFRKPVWGKGYATETTRRLLRFAFEETPLTELVATTDPENKASHNVLLKCGLTFEGARRAYAYDNCAGFRITKAEWLAARSAPSSS